MGFKNPFFVPNIKTMIKELRHQFNSEYSNEKHQELVQNITSKTGHPALFRISESPIFLSNDFKQKLQDASETILDQISAMSNDELLEAVPSHSLVPNDTNRPHFFTIDFGICENEDGDIVPQLIELQAFPTLYAYQRELKNALCEVYPFLEELREDGSDKAYYKKLKEVIIADENPENVVLLEIYPEKQKTNIDFYFTEKYLGIKTVCLTNVIKEGKKLFYDNNGTKTQIKRIYNRVIFDELENIPNLKTELDFREDLEVTWVTHPNWFFKISKYLLPKLQHEYVPRSYFLNEFPADEKIEEFVLKPLFSFAGSGVNLHPTWEELDSIQDQQNFIMQRKVQYAPIFEDPNGDFSKAEIRLLYVWPENEEQPTLMEYLVRMTKAEMVNVDFNKKDAIWIGGTTAFFSKD